MFGTQSLSGTVHFIAGAPAAAQSTLVSDKASLVADGAAIATLTVGLADRCGNPVAGSAIAFSSTGTANTFSATTCTTGSNATCSATLKSTKAEAKTITAAFGASQSASVSVTFTAGAPVLAKSRLVVAPTSLVADNAETAALTATIQDAFDNGVPNVVVSFASSGTGNTLSAPSATTGAAGVAAVTMRSTKAESKIVTATYPSAQALSATVTFRAGPPSASQSTFTASPESVFADDIATTTLSLVVRDAYSNTISGLSVTFSSGGSGNTLSATTSTTDASGRAGATLRSSVAETKTVTASFGDGQSSASVAFTPGPLASHSSLTVTPASASVDDPAGIAVIATVRDSSDHAIPGLAVTFQSTGSANTFAPASAVADSTGSVSATLKSTKAESKTVTASFGTEQTLTATVSFGPGPANATRSIIVALPGTVMADGIAEATISVLIADSHGNPIPSAEVAFSVDGSDNTLSAATATTSAAGIASTTLRSTKAETKSISASAGGATVTGAIAFVDFPAFFGSGADGDATVTTSKNLNTESLDASSDANGAFADGIAFKVSAAPSGSTIQVSGSIDGAIVPGDFVLLVDLQGTPSDFDSVETFDVIAIATASGSTLTTAVPVEKNYAGDAFANQKVVVQRIPQYRNVTIGSGGKLTAGAWDGLAGSPGRVNTGIVAFHAQGTLTIGGNGIDVSQKGFRGGVSGGSGPEDARSPFSPGIRTGGSNGGNGAQMAAGGAGGGAGAGGAGGGSANAGGAAGRGGGGGGSSNDNEGGGSEGSGGGGAAPYSSGANYSDIANGLLTLGGGEAAGAGGGAGGLRAGLSPAYPASGGKADGTGGTVGKNFSNGGAGGSGSAGGGLVFVYANAVFGGGPVAAGGGQEARAEAEAEALASTGPEEEEEVRKQTAVQGEQ